MIEVFESIPTIWYLIRFSNISPINLKVLLLRSLFELLKVKSTVTFLPATIKINLKQFYSFNTINFEDFC